MDLNIPQWHGIPFGQLDIQPTPAALPQGIVQYSYIQVHPVVVVEAITLHLHQQLVHPGWGKSWDVSPLLPGGPMSLDHYKIILYSTTNLFQPPPHILWRYLVPAVICVMLPSSDPPSIQHDLAPSLNYVGPTLAPCSVSLDPAPLYPSSSTSTISCLSYTFYNSTHHCPTIGSTRCRTSIGAPCHIVSAVSACLPPSCMHTKSCTP